MIQDIVEYGFPITAASPSASARSRDLGIGMLVMLSWVPELLNFVWAYIIRPRTNLWTRYGAPGCWAIVTGSSDGIGFAYAQELASHGFNIIMAARNKEKLDMKRQEILKKYPKVEIRIVQIDFSNDYTPSLYQGLKDELKGKDIAILVNNVGIGHAHAFETYPFSRIREVLRVTLSSFVLVSRIVLPQLLSRPRRAALITVSSATSLKPWPYFTAYGATKAFMNRFTASLAEEFRGRNVDIMNCITGEVISGTHQQGSVVSISSEQCARSQLGFLGYQSLTYGHLIHYLSACVDFETVTTAVAKSMSITFDKMWKAAEQASGSPQKTK